MSARTHTHIFYIYYIYINTHKQINYVSYFNAWVKLKSSRRFSDRWTQVFLITFNQALNNKHGSILALYRYHQLLTETSKHPRWHVQQLTFTKKGSGSKVSGKNKKYKLTSSTCAAHIWCYGDKSSNFSSKCRFSVAKIHLEHL